jgi:hypothetical protein
MIRADCLARVKATNRLVLVRRPISFTGSPPLWATTGGEYHASELSHIAKDMAITLVLSWLESGVEIVREGSTWVVHN